MKKLDRVALPHVTRAAEKRFLRSIRNAKPDARKKKGRRRRRGGRNNIEAPSKLDLYSTKNQKAFVQFLNDLKSKSHTCKRIFISFRNTHRITAAAGLLLVAEVDRIVVAHPDLQIRCSFPPSASEGRYRNSQSLVESALKQIGFFRLIGQSSPKLTNQASVRRWRQRSGDTADGSLAGSLLAEIGDSLPRLARQKMYRGAIEAISNCVEHAYPEPDSDEDPSFTDRRWWMLVGLDDERVSIVVCDLGVGIPITIPRKHDPGLIETLFAWCRMSKGHETDGELIRASTYLRRTRTHLTNRGRGGKDVRSIVEAYPTARLSIRSNKGAYTLTGEDCAPAKKDRSRRFIEDTNQRESIADFRQSIHGTIIEWTLSLEDLTK